MVAGHHRFGRLVPEGARDRRFVCARFRASPRFRPTAEAAVA
jgi:hypothetical protein